MTKPAAPLPTRHDVAEAQAEVQVEIEAMDVAEWESGQRTPQAPDANLAELVRKTATQPEPPTRVQTVARERAGTQTGAPTIPRPSSRTRTEPPGPPPRPVRARTPARGAPVQPARATRVPDIPAAPGAGPKIEPRRSPAQTPVGGVDFSLPVTATSPGMQAAPEPRRSPAQTPAGGVDFSLPVTATGEASGPASKPRPSASVRGAVEASPPVMATGETSSRRPGSEPRRSPAPMSTREIDFSRPATPTSSAAQAESPSKARPSSPASTAVAWSTPVPAASARMPAEPVGMRPLSSPPAGAGFSMPAARPPSEPARSRAAAGSASELARAATATSESGARPPEPESGPPSPFAETSRVGPGHNASPAGGLEPNTAWPPRPVPVDPSLEPRSQPSLQASPRPSLQASSQHSLQPSLRPPSRPSLHPRSQPSLQPRQLASPEPSIQRAQRPGRDDAGGADRLNVALSRRRMWWIGGGIAAASLSAVLIAVLLPGPDASPPEVSDATQAAVPASGLRRGSLAHPVDRAAADLRDRVRIARDAAAAAAAAAANAPPAAEHRPLQSAPASPGSDASAASRLPGRKPGTHKVIVDYSSRPNEPVPPSLIAQSEEDPAIGQARGAYTTGNQRLFVGDLDGAVRAYRRTLQLYPGYVGGYRGLGLAYEQLGDKASALAALQAYVSAVPNARDAALIRKRIAHLQRR